MALLQEKNRSNISSPTTMRNGKYSISRVVYNGIVKFDEYFQHSIFLKDYCRHLLSLYFKLINFTVS